MHESRSIVILSRAAQDPTDVRPPTTVTRRVRIAHSICVRMVDAMGHHPLNRPTFKRQRATSYQKIFDQLWHAVSAMRDETMISHAYAEAASHPVKDDR